MSNCVCAWVHVRVCICACMCMHACTYAFICVWIWVCVPVLLPRASFIWHSDLDTTLSSFIRLYCLLDRTFFNQPLLMDFGWLSASVSTNYAVTNSFVCVPIVPWPLWLRGRFLELWWSGQRIITYVILLDITRIFHRGVIPLCLLYQHMIGPGTKIPFLGLERWHSG